jgi:mono/diheme cytochrome c family protein
MRYFIAIYVIVILVVVSIMGSRGDLTENTPLEVFPDMDRQAKFKAQTANSLFADNQADRLPVPGTALRGNALEIENVFAKEPQISSIEFRTGKTADGNWTDFIPKELEVDLALMRLGQEKYDIHCAVCHGDYGNGQGVLAKFGIAPRNLSDASQSGTYLESAGRWTDGQIFHAISMGSASGIMLGLKDRLTFRERWAIVLYVRALQNYVTEATVQKDGGGS